MQRIVCELCRSSDFTKDDDGLFVCDFCRTKYTSMQAQSMMVEGTVRLDRSGDAANLVTMSTNALSSGNLQEAYDYANRALEIDPKSAVSWYLKGSSAGLQITRDQSRLGEMLFAFERAIEFTDEGGREEILSRCANQTITCAIKSEAESWGYTSKHASQDGVWAKHLVLAQEAMSALATAYSWVPSRLPLDPYIATAARTINGIKFTVPSEKGAINVVRTLNPQAARHTRAQIAWAGNQIRRLDPTYVTPNPNTNKIDKCFVVTATMGSETAAPVVALRDFRDTVLVDYAWGRTFTHWYGVHGPGMAQVIEGSRVRRSISFVLVVLPATVVAWLLTRRHRSRR